MTRLLLGVLLAWSEFTTKVMVPNPCKCNPKPEPGCRYCPECGKNVEPVEADASTDAAINIYCKEMKGILGNETDHEIWFVYPDQHPTEICFRHLASAVSGRDWLLGVEMQRIDNGIRTGTNFDIPATSRAIEALAKTLGVERKAELFLVED